MRESESTMIRYIAGISGTRQNGQTNFAVRDTMPGVGSDGHVADFKTLEDANKIAKERNCGFARLCEMIQKKENRSWQCIGGNGFYAWLTIPENKKPFYID